MPESGCPPGPLSRRALLRLGGGAAGLLLVGAAGGAAGRGPREAGRDHAPDLRLPVLTENGARVPVVVELDHPMTASHHVRSLEVTNPRDPVPGKGVFEFSPDNGQAYLAYQIRLDEGVSEVTASVECSRHGRWSAVEPVRVASGGGGCAAPAPSPRDAAGGIRPPVIRIPQLVRGEGLRPGALIDVQVKVRHPSRTGLALRDGVFVQETEPFHLTELVAYYGARPVSRFAMTSALSDDPLITFRLRASRAEPLRVVLANTRGQRFEATQPIRFV